MKKSLFIALFFYSSYLVAQVPIGSASNAMSAYKFHPMLDCNPQLNMVSFVFASTPGASPAKVYANYSTNGGDSWLNAASVLFNNTSAVSLPQFPNVFIYNPLGNTVADSAYLHWLSPINNSGNYNFFRTGSARPANLSSNTVNTLGVPGSNVPDDGVITQQGETYVLFRPDTTGTLTTPDSIRLMHGVWNNVSSMMDYSTIAIATPLDLNGSNVFRYNTGGIAFANDGLTGYIYLLAHHEFSINNDSAYYPIIYKTMDGGLSWSAPQVIGLSNCHNLLMTSATGNYSAGYEVDGTVDAAGNLHLVTAVAPLLANNKMDVQGGQWGLVDIYTNDGGATWNAELLSKPQTNFIGYGGGLNTYSRAQAARTWNGDHLFFGWFDTDTLTFSSTFNTHPNLFVKAYNVNTQLWTPVSNKTLGTSVADLNFFGIIAPYVMEAGSQYELPVAIALGSSGPNAIADYRYLNNLMIDSTTFTQVGSPTVLSSTLVGLTGNENSGVAFSEVYPNPAKDQFSFYVVAKKQTTVSYSLMNSTGQIVLSVLNNQLKASRNDFNIDTKQLKSGIYFLQINTNDNRTNKKVVIIAE